MTIKIQDEPRARVIVLDRPPVNALDIETLHELTEAVETCPPEAPALVVTGSGRAFSAGADLQKVLEASPSEVEEGIHALAACFEALFVFDRPLVAAINGHALAGGAVIACACDHRVATNDGTLIGAVELSAGVPFPSWALEVVRFGVNNEHLKEVVMQGRAYSSEQALGVGLVDEIVEPEKVLERALEVAAQLGSIPPTTYALTKRLLRTPFVEQARRGADASDREVIAAWQSEEVRAKVRATLEGLKGS